jgi:hypothetical protein
VPPSPSPHDRDCPSCLKPIKYGTPVVLRSGQTLHLRCWTLMLRGKMTALERNRAARARARARQLLTTGKAAHEWGPPPTET